MNNIKIKKLLYNLPSLLLLVLLMLLPGAFAVIGIAMWYKSNKGENS